MRVALLSYSAPTQDAIGNHLAEQAAALADVGAEIRLFVETAHRLHPSLRPFVHEVARVEARGPVWDFLTQADLVIATYSQFHALLNYLPLLAGGKPRLVLHYQGVTPPALWSGPAHEGIEQGVLRRGHVWSVDHALTASQAARHELADATDFPPERITSLPLPIDVARFAVPHGRWLHERLGLAADARVLLFVGRLAGNKRVPVLIEALAQLEGDTAHVVIIGDDTGPFAEEAAHCRARACALGVEERVHLLSRVDDAELVRAYRSADALVQPSLHEGFCVPVVEAMAARLPVIAARATALPETIADAGLTFTPDDADDLAAQVRRVLGEIKASSRREPAGNSAERRVAIVCFRFGPEIVGGAETSLRTLAHQLQAAGHHVEVFTTCTRAESGWSNQLPAGTVTLDGLTVHRFRVDPHERRAHDAVVAEIVASGGQVPAEIEERYLTHSIHSAALLRTLLARQNEFDAVVTGPYLFGLTADVAQALPERTLVVPCFHDEPLAHLAIWPRLYGQVGGVLYHSPEEQELAQAGLGVNHPNASQLGTFLDIPDAVAPTQRLPTSRPYVVYCGRYSVQKNLPLLLEWMTRYQAERPDQLDVVFLGQGEVRPPRTPWLHDLGRVDEARKREVLAGARALVQLSQQESLSLVVLEAWSVGRPVIVHRRCAVLAGQVERADGGMTVDGYDSFATALDNLSRDEATRQGVAGRTYVNTHYANRDAYVARVIEAIDNLRRPLADVMRERGPQRAARCDRAVWRRRFAQFIEQVLEEPERPYRDELGLEACHPELRVAWGTRTALVPMRLHNWGTHVVAAEGPGRVALAFEITELRHGRPVVPKLEAELSTLLVPGQAHTVVLPLTLPAEPGQYRLIVWPVRPELTGSAPGPRLHVPLMVEARGSAGSSPSTGGFLDTARASLADAQRLGRLPDDYVDVSEGVFGRAKRAVKQKLLNNFKNQYVDVLSRRQSTVNAQLVLAVQQLSECCGVLDHAVRGLAQRLDQIEARLVSVDRQTEPDDVEPAFLTGRDPS